ncbi:MAG: glycine--tRNA ligase, partial [Candidatus Moranbacteria bacterium]|nr:glycine--tRNA ligase [Candidatus Moranbacteria bacterium]
FEQMEMQYFLHPSIMKEKYEMWKKLRWDWYLEYGIAGENIQWHQHEKLAHYASEAYDVEYDFKSLGGFKEIEGVHARGNWDLSQHAKFSGVDLSYLDEKTGERFVPHIMETSVGLGRLFLMFLDKAYTEEEIKEGEVRTVLKLDKRLAPIKVAIFPLMKNKPELVSKAREIFDGLKMRWMCEFDDNGNVGKRYRRQDEIGTPYCVTVDFDSLEDGAVTVRDRDTMRQERIKISELENYFSDKFNN